MEVMVGIAIMSLGLTVVLVAALGALQLSSVSKERVAAFTLASKKIEYVRSLAYNSIGTVGGIPSGVIAQSETSVVNNVSYTVRTFIRYIDSEGDGLGVADQNGVTTDLKEAKVEVTWSSKGVDRVASHVATFAPNGIETTVGGGTIRVLVINAAGAPLAGAQVAISNPTAVPAVSLTAFTDTNGAVLLGGAPVVGSYSVVVSKSGYSTAQTYPETAQNVQPNPRDLLVVEGQITQATFAIDYLSTLTIATQNAPRAATTTDTFADSSRIESSSGVSVLAGAVSLTPDEGGYTPSGTFTTTIISPSNLYDWTQVAGVVTTPTGTDVSVQVLGENSTPFADSVIPGNSTGNPLGTISLADVPTSGGIRLKFTLTGGAATPEVDIWHVVYVEGPTPRANVPFTLTGAKSIGETSGGVSIPKVSLSTQSDAGGGWSSLLEWDVYTLFFDEASLGVGLSELCDTSPLSLSQGSVRAMTASFVTYVPQTLRVAIQANDGSPIPGALVEATRLGVTRSATTSSCGQVYFNGLTSGTYTITATKGGWNEGTASTAVSGATVVPLTLDPL